MEKNTGLKASNGYKLYNASSSVICNEVTLPNKELSSEWQEITIAEANEKEKEFESKLKKHN